jgi:transcriptional regulator with XRE-family HTH domain
MGRMGRPPRTVADKEMMLRMGTRLRWVREAMEKSQEQMAEIVGVHQTAWSKYESGERWPDQFKIPTIIAKLKITRAYLLEDCLRGVDQDLAIQLVADHPELAGPKRKGRRKGTDRT